MTHKDFWENITGYYGNFENDVVARLFMTYVGKIKAEDLENVFNWLVENIPASWKIDVKVLQDACRTLQVHMIKPVKKCQCCNATFTESICPACLYDPANSGDVNEYRAMYYDWQNNRDKFINRVTEATRRAIQHHKVAL